MVEAVALAPAAAVYVFASRRVEWPLRRSIAFLAGVAALAVAAGLGDHPLARHMAAHALLVAVAAPLLVLGAPVGLALRALPRAHARGLASILRSRPVGALIHPAFAWTAFVAIQLAFHVTPLFDLALRDSGLHAVEHALFLATALAFWECAIAGDPVPERLAPPLRALYLLAAMPAMDVSGIYLMAVGRGAAGAAMMIGSMPLGLAAAAVGWRWLELEDARQARREAMGAAG